MTDVDMPALMDAAHNIGDFKQIIFDGDEPTDADWERLIKAAEDILKLAGAR
jgi:hypothetical protein